MKLNSQSQLKKVIRNMGIKVTQQRLTILEHIFNGKEHITAQEVYERVRETSPEVGFATVYRFLRTLSDHKTLTELRMNGLPARYEWADKKHHDHLSCKSCSKIVEFENSEIEIINDLGQTISRLSFSNQIDVSRLAQGFYFIQINTIDKKFLRLKFIKE